MKVLLVCAAGMSTSLLLRKMKKYAEGEGVDLELTARPVPEVYDAEDFDAVLLGPQIAYQLDAVKERLGDIPIDVIPMRDYGRQNCAAIFDRLVDMLV